MPSTTAATAPRRCMRFMGAPPLVRVRVIAPRLDPREAPSARPRCGLAGDAGAGTASRRVAAPLTGGSRWWRNASTSRTRWCLMEGSSAANGPGLQIEGLQASRARIAAAAMAERRRIERELHDGVQQHLVAVIVNLQLARELADTDLEGAKAVLDELSADAREALESVRELGHELYPSLLRDRGPAEAVRAAAVASGRAGARRGGSAAGWGGCRCRRLRLLRRAHRQRRRARRRRGPGRRCASGRRTALSGSRSRTTGWASIRARRGVTAASRASPMRWARSGARSRSTSEPGRGDARRRERPGGVVSASGSALLAEVQDHRLHALVRGRPPRRARA